jgi:hypothetical protein
VSSTTTGPISSLAAPTVSTGQLDVLKVIAFLAMLSDHANKVLWHNAHPGMSIFGRLAFPLFAWCFAYSVVHHMRDTRRFVRNAIIFSLLAQVPFFILFIHAKKIGCLSILPVFLFAWLVNRLEGWKGIPREAFQYPLFALAGLLTFDASYSWFGVGFVLCCIGFIRSGGWIYGAAVLALLVLVLVGSIGSEAMFLPIVAVVLLISSVGKIGQKIPRFLPRNALYLGYVGHLWALYLFTLYFHQ